MAKNEQILRLKLIEQILRKRKKQGATYLEIKEILENEFIQLEKTDEFKFSEKTFQRDRADLFDIFNLNVIFDRKINAYRISDEDLEIEHENVFDNLLLINAYRSVENRKDVMFFEDRKPRGLQHLHGLLHAITNQLYLKLTYQSFWSMEEKELVLEAYALKEFRYRWYLLAKEKGKSTFKSYALDRIKGFEITSSTFKKEDINPNESYQHCFGIVSQNDHALEEIQLRFTSQQGQYIKSLPLHPSQNILSDTDEGLVISLQVYPTFDFIQEVLSHGDLVEVLAPKSLRKTIEDKLFQSLKLYQTTKKID